MKYILTQEELDKLVPMADLIKEEEKVAFLLKIIKEKTDICVNKNGSSYCDDCPIASLNNNMSEYTSFCEEQIKNKTNKIDNNFK